MAGIHFVGHTYSAEQVNEVMALGFDAVEVVRLFDCLNHRTLSARLITRIRSEYFYHPRIVPYREALKSFIGEEEKDEHVYPTIILTGIILRERGVKDWFFIIQLRTYLKNISSM